MYEVPFILTITLDLALSSYLLSRPTKPIRQLMQITHMTSDFKISLVAFAIFGFLVSWVAEQHAFPFIARFWASAYLRIQLKGIKKRRQYKVLLEEMQS
jgi:cation-transporting P-type ATPase 13A2